MAGTEEQIGEARFDELAEDWFEETDSDSSGFAARARAIGDKLGQLGVKTVDAFYADRSESGLDAQRWRALADAEDTDSRRLDFLRQVGLLAGGTAAFGSAAFAKGPSEGGESEDYDEGRLADARRFIDKLPLEHVEIMNSMLAIPAFGMAIKEFLHHGHFSEKSWTAALAHLAVHFTFMHHSRIDFFTHLMVDVVMLIPVGLGTTGGDRLPAVAERLKKKSRFEVDPEAGLSVNAENLVEEAINSISIIELASGAGAIHLDECFTDMTYECFFKPKFEEIEAAFHAFREATESNGNNQKEVCGKVDDILLKDLKNECKNNFRPSEITQRLDSIRAYLEESREVFDPAGSNPQARPQDLAAMDAFIEAFEAFDRTLRYPDLKTNGPKYREVHLQHPDEENPQVTAGVAYERTEDGGPSEEDVQLKAQYDSLSDLIQSLRSWANNAGKLLLGDPPNFILWKQVAAGKLTVGQAIAIQVKTFTASAGNLLTDFERDLKHIREAFGDEAADSLQIEIKNVLGRIAKEAVIMLYGIAKPFIIAMRQAWAGGGAAKDLLKAKLSGKTKQLDEIFIGPEGDEMSIVRQIIILLRDEFGLPIPDEFTKSDTQILEEAGALYGEMGTAIIETTKALRREINPENFIQTDSKQKAEFASEAIGSSAWRNNLREDGGFVADMNKNVLEANEVDELPKSTREERRLFMKAVQLAEPDDCAALIQLLGKTAADCEVLITNIKSVQVIKGEEEIGFETKHIALQWKNMEQVFGKLDAARDFLIQRAILRALRQLKGTKELDEDITQKEIYEVVEGITSEYGLGVDGFIWHLENFTHQALPTIKDVIGEGTEEVMGLVLLQVLFLQSVMPSVYAAVDLIVASEGIEKNEHGEYIGGKELSEDASDKIISMLVMLCSVSAVADNLAMYMCCAKVLEGLMAAGLISHETFLFGTEMCYKSAIEFGALTPAGGPASAPWSDEKSNAFRRGWKTVFANTIANLPILNKKSWLKQVFISTGLKLLFEAIDSPAAKEVLKIINEPLPGAEPLPEEEIEEEESSNSALDAIKKYGAGALRVAVNSYGAELPVGYVKHKAAKRRAEDFSDFLEQTVAHLEHTRDLLAA